jgi:hypothetical protein
VGTGALARQGRDGFGRGFFSPPLPMIRFSAEQLDCMRNQLSDSLERFHSTRRTSRQVQKQRAAARSAYASTQRGKRSFLGAISPHDFGNAV